MSAILIENFIDHFSGPSRIPCGQIYCPPCSWSSFLSRRFSPLLAGGLGHQPARDVWYIKSMYDGYHNKGIAFWVTDNGPAVLAVFWHPDRYKVIYRESHDHRTFHYAEGA